MILPECFFRLHDEQTHGNDEVHALAVAQRRIVHAVSLQNLTHLLYLEPGVKITRLAFFITSSPGSTTLYVLVRI